MAICRYLMQQENEQLDYHLNINYSGLTKGRQRIRIVIPRFAKMYIKKKCPWLRKPEHGGYVIP